MSKTADGQSWRTGVRDGFDRDGKVICEGCFQKKLQIEELREEVRRLKERLRHREQGAIPLGAHSPSSQRPLKPKSTEENREKQGGAKVGHKGYGRRRLEPANAEARERISAPVSCPKCSSELQFHSIRQRTVFDAVEVRVSKNI